MEVMDYTVTDWSHKMIVAAGGADVMADIGLPHARVSSEQVVARNPQVIVVRAMPPNLLGHDTSGEQKVRDTWQAILDRPGWGAIDAVSNRKVYLLAFEICSAPRSPIGILHMAKWFYPELFPDLDPEQVHHEFLGKFFGLEDYSGMFTYPQD